MGNHRSGGDHYRDWSEFISRSTLNGDIVRQTDGPMARTAEMTLDEALRHGPPPPGNLAVPIFRHGSLEVEMYTPAGSDPQTPHERDEVYVVARVAGIFFNGTESREVQAGSFIFVPAKQEHRFESFSPDFAVWVFFYGPAGGESSG